MPIVARQRAHRGSDSSAHASSPESGPAASMMASKVSGANPDRNAKASTLCSSVVKARRSRRSSRPLSGTWCATKTRGFINDLMVMPSGRSGVIQAVAPPLLHDNQTAISAAQLIISELQFYSNEQKGHVIVQKNYLLAVALLAYYASGREIPRCLPARQSMFR